MITPARSLSMRNCYAMYYLKRSNYNRLDVIRSTPAVYRRDCRVADHEDVLRCFGACPEKSGKMEK